MGFGMIRHGKCPLANWVGADHQHLIAIILYRSHFILASIHQLAQMWETIYMWPTVVRYLGRKSSRWELLQRSPPSYREWLPTNNHSFTPIQHWACCILPKFSKNPLSFSHKPTHCFKKPVANPQFFGLWEEIEPPGGNSPITGKTWKIYIHCKIKGHHENQDQTWATKSARQPLSYVSHYAT